jgi:hypothetical protein
MYVCLYCYVVSAQQGQVVPIHSCYEIIILYVEITLQIVYCLKTMYTAG